MPAGSELAGEQPRRSVDQILNDRTQSYDEKRYELLMLYSRGVLDSHEWIRVNAVLRRQQHDDAAEKRRRDPVGTLEAELRELEDDKRRHPAPQELRNDDEVRRGPLPLEEANAELSQPAVFDPAMYPSYAVRPGEPRFDNAARASAWYQQRRRVMQTILAAIAASDLRDRLILRGSAAMAAWFPDRARQPGDLDFVVHPATMRADSDEATALLRDLQTAVRGTVIDDATAIADRDFATTDIWTYERAEGRRLVVPWLNRWDPGLSGTIQIDLVFEDELLEPAGLQSITLDESPPVAVWLASRELSLAWKIQWLAGDNYPMGKDLYDAVLLVESLDTCEAIPALVSALVSRDAKPGEGTTTWASVRFELPCPTEWAEFVSEYPHVTDRESTYWRRLLSQLPP